MSSEVNIAAALLAGLLSFVSPCVLPLVPAFLSYLGGVGLRAGEKASRMRVFLNSFAYVLGFTAVFSLLGVLLNGVLGGLAYGARVWLERVGGLVIIFFGLCLLGLINIGFMEEEHRVKPGKFRRSYLFSFLFGASFAVGWSPCVGAILGAILTLAAASPGQSFALLFAYSIGLGIPFLIAGAFVAQSQQLIRKAGPLLRYFNIVAGVLLIILGILVFTGTLSKIADFGLAQLALGGN